MKKTTVLTLMLVSNLAWAQEKGLRDVRPPADAPVSSLGLIIGAVVLCGFIATVLYFVMEKFLKSQDAVQTSPAERAQAQLLELQTSNYPMRGEYKIYYSQLSAILRGFIEEQLGMDVTDRTTEEFLNTVSRDPRFNDAQKQALNRFLQHSDQVKFAKHLPTPDEAIESMRLVNSFIEQFKGV